MMMIFGVRQSKAKSLNSSFSVMHVNIRSLRKNLDNQEPLILCLESPTAILCLTETWLKDTDETRSYLDHGYNQYVSRNRSENGGGVMV